MLQSFTSPFDFVNEATTFKSSTALTILLRAEQRRYGLLPASLETIENTIRHGLRLDRHQHLQNLGTSRWSSLGHINSLSSRLINLLDIFSSTSTSKDPFFFYKGAASEQQPRHQIPDSCSTSHPHRRLLAMDLPPFFIGLKSQQSAAMAGPCSFGSEPSTMGRRALRMCVLNFVCSFLQLH